MPDTDSLDSLLGSFKPDPDSPHALTIQKALFVARSLQERARALQTSSERRQQAELDRMLQTPSDKATLALMTDQAFRTSDPARAVEHLTYILDVQGVPRFFGPDRPHADERLPVFRRIRAGRRVAAGQGAHAEGDGQRHPAGREGSAHATSCRTPHRRCADERQLPRRGGPERSRVRAPAAAVPAGAAVARDRGGLDQDLHAVLADLAAGSRAHGQRALRPAGAPVPHRGSRALHPSRWSVGTQVRVPGHGGVQGQGTDRSSVHAHAGPGRPAARQGRHRAAELHPRLVPHAAATAGMGATTRRQRRRAHHHPARERAPTWRASEPSHRCADGRRRLTRRSSRPTRTTSAWSTRS